MYGHDSRAVCGSAAPFSGVASAWVAGPAVIACEISMPSKSDFSAMYALLSYWYGLVLCLHLGRPYASLSASLPALPPRRGCKSTHCASICACGACRRRSITFANDMRKNLRNVALPGTGLALSYLCTNYLVAVLFLWIGVPLAAFAAASSCECVARPSCHRRAVYHASASSMHLPKRSSRAAMVVVRGSTIGD